MAYIAPQLSFWPLPGIDTGPNGSHIPMDGALDRICDLVMRFLNCEAAVVYVIDRDGLFAAGQEGMRRTALCVSSAMKNEVLMDGRSVDPRTLTNPLVAVKAGLDFYAGVPLRTTDGHDLGMLVALDIAPRNLRDDELDSLKLFAQVVVDMLELHFAGRA